RREAWATLTVVPAADARAIYDRWGWRQVASTWPGRMPGMAVIPHGGALAKRGADHLRLRPGQPPPASDHHRDLGGAEPARRRGQLLPGAQVRRHGMGLGPQPQRPTRQ